ncbi:hypothetical protein OROMI_005138 [Orobanche minor]
MEVGLAFRDYNGRISSLDYHKAASYVVTASDDESIRLYDLSTATCLKIINTGIIAELSHLACAKQRVLHLWFSGYDSSALGSTS